MTPGSIFIVQSRSAGDIIAVCTTLEKAQRIGAEHTQDKQRQLNIVPNWTIEDGLMIDNIPYDADDYDVSIQQWDVV